MSKNKPVKWPFICRLCKLGILKLYCKVCPPLSVLDQMTDDARHTLLVQMRIDEEAKSIVSNVDPETRKYFAELKKRMRSDEVKEE